MARRRRFAAPLRLRPGRWYQVGATEYGGPGDPSSGAYGSIPDPAQAYLPAHPDSFAELSVLAANPANDGTFTFADANALGQPALPDGRCGSRTPAGSWCSTSATSATGRAPGRRSRTANPTGSICGGRPPGRSDVTKSAGDGCARARPAVPPATLEALPRTSSTNASAGVRTGLAGSAPLPLAPGVASRILPDGLAAAGEEAPARGARR